MAITPNDLRIGNWICDFGDGNGQVQGIDADGYVLTSANDVYQPHETFAAIPLNEDWLFNFGFKVLNGGYFKSPYMIEIASTKTMRYTLYQGIEDLATIENVHELQNLYFSLTGTELVLSGEEKSLN